MVDKFWQWGSSLYRTYEIIRITKYCQKRELDAQYRSALRQQEKSSTLRSPLSREIDNQYLPHDLTPTNSFGWSLRSDLRFGQ